MSKTAMQEEVHQDIEKRIIELEKERNELKDRFEKSFTLAEIRRKEIDKLILELGELEKERDEYREGFNDLSNIRTNLANERNLYRESFENAKSEIESLKKENERLKGMIGISEEEYLNRLRNAQNKRQS
jgi:chromosome segregation ATPase